MQTDKQTDITICAGRQIDRDKKFNRQTSRQAMCKEIDIQADTLKQGADESNSQAEADPQI